MADMNNLSNDQLITIGDAVNDVLKKRVPDLPAADDGQRLLSGQPMVHPGGGSYTGGAAQQPGTFSKALYDAGFDLTRRPSVTIPLKVTFPAAGTWNTQGPGGVLPLGTDTRFLFPNIPTQDVGNATTIADFRQSGDRTVTGDIERAPESTAEKATLGLTISHVTTAVKQLALVIPGIPNQVLRSIESASAFLESEAVYQIRSALDAHVYAAILGATPGNSQTGTDMIAQVRNGITVMRAAGMNPNLLVLEPADAAALDLIVTPGTADYQFASRDTGTSSPLWGLQVVERRTAAATDPLLLDAAAIGVLFTGMMRIDADPYSGFSTNVTRLRIELNCVMHVRNIAAAHRVAAT
jgi:hypothetical protein